MPPVLGILPALFAAIGGGEAIANAVSGSPKVPTATPTPTTTPNANPALLQLINQNKANTQATTGQSLAPDALAALFAGQGVSGNPDTTGNGSSYGVAPGSIGA